MKESSRFYSSLGLLIILNLVIKPLWIFGIDRQVQNVTGPSVYGIYFSLLNLSIVFSFLLDWGLTSFLNRRLAAQPSEEVSNTGQLFLLKLIFAFGYTAIIIVTAWLTGISNWHILLCIVLIQVFNSLFLFFRAIITARQWFRTDAWLSVLDKTGMLIFCGVLLYYPSLFGGITINRFLIAQISCTALAMFFALAIISGSRIRFSIAGTFRINKELLLEALPFAIIVLLMSVHYRLDGFLLERMRPDGAYQAGIYASAYRLLDAANMIGFLVASFLLPFIARQWRDKKSIASVVLNSRHFLLLIAIAASCVCFFLAPWIEKILYHNNNADAIKTLQLCIPALIGYSLVQVYGTILTATGQIKSFCYITLLAVIINAVLNLALIPVFGAVGCCLAALASQWFCGFTAMLYVKQKSGVPLGFRSALIYIFTAVILSAFLYYSKDLAVSKWILVVAAGIITLSAMALSKLFVIHGWIAAWRKALR